MDNYLNVVSGRFEKLFDIEYHQNDLVSSLKVILKHTQPHLLEI